MTKKAYKDGFKTGKTWSADYRPGGPYVGSLGYAPSEKWKASHEQQVNERKEWLRGFDNGLAKQKSET